MKITLLCDDPGSWILTHVRQLKGLLVSRGHKVVICSDANEVTNGDCAFFLSCKKIVPKQILKRNKHNLVVHESALPKGKGWAPLTWQILEGKNQIPISLFEAVEEVDAGSIYLQDTLYFEGHELADELRHAQGDKTIEMILKFVDTYPPREATAQNGKESFYRRRRPEDGKLDFNKTIAEQFNLLRVVDNERYPAFFKHLGHIYYLKIEKKY